MGKYEYMVISISRDGDKVEFDAMADPMVAGDLFRQIRRHLAEGCSVELLRREVFCWQIIEKVTG